MNCKPVIVILLIFMGIGASAQTKRMQDSVKRNIVVRCYATTPTAEQTGIWRDAPLYHTEVILLRDSIFIQEFRANKNGYIYIPEVNVNDLFYAKDMYYNRSTAYRGTDVNPGDTLEIRINIKILRMEK